LSALLPQTVFFAFFLLSKLSCLLVIDWRVHCEHSSGLLSTRAGWDYFWPNFADSKSYTCRLRNSVLLLGFYVLSASKFQSVDYLFINIPVCFCVFVEMLLCSFLKCPMFWFHMVSTTWTYHGKSAKSTKEVGLILEGLCSPIARWKEIKVCVPSVYLYKHTELTSQRYCINFMEKKIFWSLGQTAHDSGW